MNTNAPAYWLKERTKTVPSQRGYVSGGVYAVHRWSKWKVIDHYPSFEDAIRIFDAIKLIEKVIFPIEPHQREIAIFKGGVRIYP